MVSLIEFEIEGSEFLGPSRSLMDLLMLLGVSNRLEYISIQEEEEEEEENLCPRNGRDECLWRREKRRREIIKKEVPGTRIPEGRATGKTNRPEYPKVVLAIWL